MISMVQLRLLKINTNIVKKTAGIRGLCSYRKQVNYLKFATIDCIPTKSIKRELSTRNIVRVPSSLSDKNPFSKEENDEFDRYYPEFVEILIGEKPFNTVPKFIEKLREVLQFNVGYGINARGVATVAAYRAFKKGEDCSAENIRLAIMLGWCIRMVESSILSIDDIVDNADTRCGKRCWFKNKNVGLKAVIDGFYLENGAFYVLQKFFSTHPQYLNLVELFLESNFKTSLGQSLDLMDWSLDDFTMENYDILTIGKAQYCLFIIPVVAAMFLANIHDQEMHRHVRSLLSSMGTYYQMQNDFLDCYGNPEDTGKIGSDIREGKCSWLAVKALQKASSRQRIIIQKNYGKADDESILKIRNLYNDMNLEEEYKRCEKQTYSNICLKITQLPENLPRQFFQLVLEELRNGKWGT